MARARRYRGVERRILACKDRRFEKQRSMLKYLRFVVNGSELRGAFGERRPDRGITLFRNYVCRNGRPARNLFSRSCRRASRVPLRARRN